jgi:cation-transporting ATPase 13A3/4/5
LTVFHYQQLPYFFTGTAFEPLLFDSNLSFKNLIDTYGKGLNDKEKIEENRTLFGICLILVPIQPLSKLILGEVFNPFYIFQLYSVLLWFFAEDYYTYAASIVVITIISLISSISTTRRGQVALHKLAKKTCRVKVLRGGNLETVDSTELVPGDLIEIDSEMELPCDLVLISGGCIVEEGMLTGESVPVIKDCISYLDDVMYDADVERRHTLYEGTKVIQTRNYSGYQVRAIVVRTGFKTIKGRLVRSIMYPKPNKFKFYEDSLKFIAFLAFLTLLGFFVSIPRMIELEYNTNTLVVRILDMITVTVPPALPACMSVGIAFAINRLKKNRIYCIVPNRVNVAGRIDMMVFDKTGTLTEDGMDLMGVQMVGSNSFMAEMVEKPNDHCPLMTECMASCHSLALANGKLLGDTQDIQIFKATNWEYDEPDNENYDPIVKAVVKPHQSPNEKIFSPEESLQMIDLAYELGILHIFHFTSKLKRMGVIVKNLSSHDVIYYSKGAPEVILDKCTSVPSDLNKTLAAYTRNGYRVLACAYKSLPNFKYSQIGTLKIEDLEENLTFIGLIILQNKLKKATIPSLKALNEAGIKTIMATGDAVLTGISVGRECGIIDKNITVYLGELEGNSIVWQLFAVDEAGKTMKIRRPPWVYHSLDESYVLAMTGTAFAFLISNAEKDEQEKKTLHIVLEKCQIFARMAPEHKTYLVEKLQTLNYLVGMCGDGANDCGALKTADIGVSLSEADSSIAAPFTSQIADISSVLTVLREGRCALTTSIQCFKYMALYSMIQFTSISIIYWFYSNFSNNQYTLFDLITVLPLSVFMSRTGPVGKLSEHQPPSELISFRIISSVVAQAILQALFQCGSFMAAAYTYYEIPHVELGVDSGFYTFQNTVIVFISWAEYQIVCATFSIGKPWKQPSYKNYPFTVLQVILAAALLIGLFVESKFIRELLVVRNI